MDDINHKPQKNADQDEFSFRVINGYLNEFMETP